MGDTIYYVIGLISSAEIVWTNISAYLRNEYDPILFRFRKGYELKVIDIIAYFGSLLPLFSLKIPYRYIYLLIVYSVIFLTMTILNLKCYISTKRKRILIETMTFDLIWIITALLIYKMLLT
jgi:hypothetical protein